MLIEFSVENFRSIGDRQTLSMVAGPSDEHRSTHVVAPGAPATPELLLGLVMYGSNAAGKSNVIRALKFMEQFVLGSAREGTGDAPIEREPFALAEGMRERPSRFEVIFVQDSVRYQYGFALTADKVVGEWLYAFPEGRPQKWFERNENWADPESNPFGPSLKGEKRTWRKATRPNALFLSTAVQLNAEQLTPIFNWFFKTVRFLHPGSLNGQYSANRCLKEPEWKTRVLKFLQDADLSIEDIGTEAHRWDPADLPSDLPDEFKGFIRSAMEGKDIVDVKLLHRTTSGTSVEFDIEDESDGTRKLFALSGPWLNVLEKGWVLVVDELDTSLHPIVMRALIQKFFDPKINRAGAQLIFTTHDTSVLDLALFRRDQVWFVEKDKGFQTTIYPLTEFSPRKGENVNKGYLQGRYGAVPFVGDVAF